MTDRNPQERLLSGASTRLEPALDAVVDEPGLRLIGGLIALKLAVGDVVTLRGDLGAGKTTLARAIIRSLLDDLSAEVASPTFPLVQEYVTPRLAIRHYDFYRLADSAEVDELGIDEALAEGAAIVEWPDRAGHALSPDRFDITLAEAGSNAGGENVRRIQIQAAGAAAARARRIGEIVALLGSVPNARRWMQGTAAYLQGDASPRAYARLTAADGATAILMDSPRQPDGPPIRAGLPYSRIAHIAEDVRPFATIADHLTEAGLSAPALFAADLERGLLLIEDFGDLTFARALTTGVSQHALWRAALEPLAILHGAPPPATTPRYDPQALTIETELLLDWYWPALTGVAAPAAVRAAFLAAWRPLIELVSAAPAGLVLRDYHSPNLMWLPDRDDACRVGILDFQDAVVGSPAYDVVSMLQDARIDVPHDLEKALLGEHIADLERLGKLIDREQFLTCYAILGAQRATKILGIFARLSRRDGKHGYLAHIPRIWGYLERNLAHPALAGVRAWYDANLSAAARSALLPQH